MTAQENAGFQYSGQKPSLVRHCLRKDHTLIQVSSSILEFPNTIRITV